MRTRFILCQIAALLLGLLPSLLLGDVALATPVPGASGSQKSGRLETHQDLIAKAQNLTLQRDRLQASQILIRGIQRESKGSAAAKELTRALDELTSIFYTDKAQSLFATAEAQPETRAREAIEQYQEALRLEENNLTVLRALARALLRVEECDRADASVRSAEAINPYSSEIRLLRLQVLDCQKKPEQIPGKLAGGDTGLESIEKFTRGFVVEDLLRRNEIKKARAIVSSWEAAAPDYPEVFYWKWRVSKQSGEADRNAALKYSQLCQNLTPRKRKAYSLDTNLCKAKSKEAIEAYLKSSGLQSIAPGAKEGEE